MTTRAIPAPFLPPWARRDGTAHHARTIPTHTLGDTIRADIRAERMATDGRPMPVRRPVR
jgi:hypothetical protein